MIEKIGKIMFAVGLIVLMAVIVIGAFCLSVKFGIAVFAIELIFLGYVLSRPDED